MLFVIVKLLLGCASLTADSPKELLLTAKFWSLHQETARLKEIADFEDATIRRCLEGIHDQEKLLPILRDFL